MDIENTAPGGYLANIPKKELVKMKMKFEAVDKIAIDNLGPMGPYEYVFIACGALAINKDQHGNIQVEVGDGQTVYGDDIKLELTDGYAHLLVWTGCKVSAVFFGYYDDSEGE